MLAHGSAEAPPGQSENPPPSICMERSAGCRPGPEPRVALLEKGRVYLAGYVRKIDEREDARRYLLEAPVGILKEVVELPGELYEREPADVKRSRLIVPGL